MATKVEDNNGELVFTVQKQEFLNRNKSGVVQISPEAMYALEIIKAETKLPTNRIATELILFATKHYSIKTVGKDESGESEQ